MSTTTTGTTRSLAESVQSYPLLDALVNRRSRRFGRGFTLNGGPLAYESQRDPEPLTIEEEAALAFAACGITGFNLADVPYQTGDVPEAGGGNMWTQFLGRTVPSPDAVSAVAVFVINDDGAWMLKRPQDYERDEIAGLAESARTGNLADLYERSRVRVADGRVGVPREFSYTLPVNKWSTNQPGSTYFLPIAEQSEFMINVLLTAFDDEWAAFTLDDRNMFRPAGVGKYARSKGGHLNDDPADQRIMPVTHCETLCYELLAVETGAIIQNLGLMTQALGLGGFPHFVSHPFGWYQALGFRMQDIPTSKVSALGPLMKLGLKAMKRDLPMPTAVGLERGGEVLLKPYCPPYYRCMQDAVLAFVESKYGEGTGTFRDGGAATAWRDGETVQRGIPRPSDKAIQATIDFCEYIYARHGRFPAANGPFRTTVAYQAHELDPDFYERFYREDALSETQRARG